MPGSGVVRAAIVQAKWTGDTASMIEVHESYARAAAERGEHDRQHAPRAGVVERARAE